MALTEKYVSSLAAGGGTGASGSPYTFAEMVTEINGGSAAGTRYNVKADGTYSFAANVTISGAGTVGSPIIVRGYSSGITDGYLGRISGNQALVTTNMPLLSFGSSYSLTLMNTTKYLQFESLRFTGSVNNALFAWSSSSTAFSRIIRCSVANAGNGSSAQAVGCNGSGCDVSDNDLSTSGSTSGYVLVLAGESNAFANRLSTTSGTITAVATIAARCGFAFNTLKGGAVGLDMSAHQGCKVWFNTFYGHTTTAIRTQNSAATYPLDVKCNMITDCGRAILNQYNATAAHAISSLNNRTRDNTNADLGFGDWPYLGDVTTDTGGAETDYTDAASGDFRLISSSPAKGAGIPAYADIGALQRQESGGIIRTGMNGGFQ